MIISTASPWGIVVAAAFAAAVTLPVPVPFPQSPWPRAGMVDKAARKALRPRWRQ